MHHLRGFFEQNGKMTDQDWDFISYRLVKREYPKKHILVANGSVENYISFMESGIIRFFIRREESDLTFDFAFENSFVSAYISFIQQSPCYYNLECLSACTLWQISYSDLQEIYRETSIGNLIGRHACESLFIATANRVISLLDEHAEERYLSLLKHQPRLIQQIPLKYLASYIGITPQALSRIRKKIS